MALQYQLFPALSKDEYASLREDIARRGILIPIEVDVDTGELLDGHHRLQIAQELGIEAPKVTRHFETDADRLAHVIALNLKRRHLDPVTWAYFFDKLIANKIEIIVNSSPDTGQNLTIKKKAVIEEAARELGVSVATAYDRLSLLDLSDEEKQEVQQTKRTPRTAKQEHKRKSRIEAAKVREEDGSRALPGTSKTFQTIVIDPPWAYDRDDIRGAAEQHYDTLTFDEIAAYPVGKLAGPDAHLYLWVTNPHLPHVWRIVEAWGFDYKTMLTWVKPQMGNGHYFRGATEHVLFCTRGNLPIRDRGIRNWFEADRTEHSAKPDAFYELVERASFGPFVELFARRKREGWDVFGDEANAG